MFSDCTLFKIGPLSVLYIIIIIIIMVPDSIFILIIFLFSLFFFQSPILECSFPKDQGHIT